MKALLADIELDVQELKCILDALSRDKTSVLCNVAKRNVLRMRRDLDQLLDELDTITIEDNQIVTASSANECLKNIDSEVQEPIDTAQLMTDQLSINKEDVGCDDAKVMEEPENAVAVEDVLEDALDDALDDSSKGSLEEANLADTNKTEKDEHGEAATCCISNDNEHSPIVDWKEIDWKETDGTETDRTETAPILADRLKPSDDLRRSISLNDSFRFSRELFGGDNERMNRVLQQVGAMSSLNAALAFLEAETNKQEDDETLIDLQEIVRKYFI